MKLRPGEFLRPATPSFPAIDAEMGGVVVEVIGHVVDANGREIAAVVSTMVSRRALTDLRPLPAAPAFRPVEDDQR